jgi:hypothetical protein
VGLPGRLERKRKRERGGDGRLAELRELNAQSPGIIY